MPRGLSLNIGLNQVDPQHYAGWNGQLNGCIFDASDMFDIASSMGFQGVLLVDKKANRSNVINEIKQAATTLVKGDIFLLSFAGHGDQIKDKNNDESDGYDETWCLYDSQLIDDEIYQLLSHFSTGVRVLVISDSCHSGTIIKWNPFARHKPPRLVPGHVSAKTYARNKDYYDKLVASAVTKPKVTASVKLISACQDNQLADDGDFNGAFTAALLEVWNNGQFDGNYSKFHKQIQHELPSYQSPKHLNLGKPDFTFSRQKPFTI